MSRRYRSTLSPRRLRPLGVIPSAIVGIAAAGVLPVVGPGLVAHAKTVVAEAMLRDTESWIMGGSGLPIPPPEYLTALSERYVNPGAFPDFSGTTLPFTTPNGVHQPVFDVSPANMNPLFTPEGLYPLTGVKSLDVDTSVQQGVSILNSTITDQITAGHSVVAVGYSQSATIASLEMDKLLALPPSQQPTAEQLAFVLVGDPNNPDGGLDERFNLPGLPLTIPSVGITFNGATPPDAPWDTAIYTQEYDGFADFPKYPINLLSDINAFLGIMFVHGSYPAISADKVASAIALPTTDDAGHTSYFMMPTETLPLLQPLLSIPVVGQPLYDLLEPDMRVLVNLGYGSITDGWDQGPANVPTPFGFLPTNLNPADVFSALSSGAQQGVQHFMSDLEHLGTSSAQSISDTVDHATSIATGALPSFTDIVNAFSSASSDAYAALLPTADIINFLVTTLPAYNASLFAHELTSGNFLDALGMPISADFGLGTMAAGFEYEVIQNTITSIQADLSGIL